MEDIVRIATELENLKIAFLEDVFGFCKSSLNTWFNPIQSGIATRLAGVLLVMALHLYEK